MHRNVMQNICLCLEYKDLHFKDMCKQLPILKVGVGRYRCLEFKLKRLQETEKKRRMHGERTKEQEHLDQDRSFWLKIRKTL